MSAGPNPIFRVFVSSTFSDLKAEREALQREVFPKLRKLCRRHGCRFQAIDLRWGVSEEASYDQQTMQICRTELARCQKTTPRPNFVVLLGDRYGWQPLPEEIPAHEFTRILSRLRSLDGGKCRTALLHRWYRRDDNADPPVYVLQPRTGKYREQDKWQPVETELRKLLLSAVAGLDLLPGDRLKYGSSATAQEIWHGARQVEQAQEHVHCFLRTIEALPLDEGLPGREAHASLRDYVDLDAHGQVDEAAQRRLDCLRDELACRLPGNLHFFEATWRGGGDCSDPMPISPDHLPSLCNEVYDTLARVIQAEMDGLEQMESVDQEIQAHAAFGQERAQGFWGREDLLSTIHRYLNRDNPSPLVIYGASGTGKSALMARAAAQAMEQYPAALVVRRFIGATPASSDIRLLLESLCREISRAYGVRDDDLPVEFRKLEEEFPRRLALATQDQPLVLFLDALDQLSDAEQARRLYWLPAQLPPNVHLVLSALQGDTPQEECLSVLKKKLSAANLLELASMPRGEGEKLLDSWLEDAERKLQDHQRREVLGRFAAHGLPLHLKLAFEEARRWRSYTPPETTRLSEDVPGLIRDLFQRLSQPANHGRLLVSRTLGYLAAGKNGLTEDELQEVISRDQEVYGTFLAGCHHFPSDLLDYAKRYFSEATLEAGEEGRHEEAGVTEPQAILRLLKLRQDPDKIRSFLSSAFSQGKFFQLPPILWSRLSFDLQPYLAQRAADGAMVLAFFHRQLREVVEEDYLSGPEKTARHAALARYFDEQPLYLVAGQWDSRNVRKVSELSFQQTQGELWDDLEKKTLCDLRFIEAKCAAGMTYDLVKDYQQAIANHPEGKEEREKEEERQNKIKCYTEKMIAYARAWNEARFKHWQDKQHYPIPGPKDLPLLPEPPHSVSKSRAKISQDMQRIITKPKRLDRIRTFAQFVMGEAHLLKDFGDLSGFVIQQAWNSSRNGLISQAAETLINQEPQGIFCLMHPDQRGDFNPSPPLLRTLQGHTDHVSCVDMTLDGTKVISGSRDNSLRLWDLNTGRCIHNLNGHTKAITCVAMTPDGRVAISRSEDGTLLFWNLNTGLCTKVGLEMVRANCVAITPDGSLVVYGGYGPDSGSSINILQLETGKCITLKNPYGNRSIAITPNGKFALAGGYDGTLSFWNLDTGHCLDIAKDHNGEVGFVALTPDAKYAASGGKDGTLCLWHIEAGKFSLKIEKSNNDWISGVAMTPDGRNVLYGCHDGDLTLYDFERDKDLLSIECYRNPKLFYGIWDPFYIRDVAIRADGLFAVTAGTDEKLYQWNLYKSETSIRDWHHYGDVTCVELSPNNHIAITGGGDEELGLYYISNNKFIRFGRHEDWVRCVTISPDGTKAVSGSDDGEVRIWDLNLTSIMNEPKCLGILSGHSGWVTDIKISLDGGRIISGSDDKSIRIWDLESWECLHTLEGHIFKLSLDNHFVISGNKKGDLSIWDSDTGSLSFTLKGHNDSIISIDIIDDGFNCLSASLDGTIRLWDLNNRQCSLIMNAGVDWNTIFIKAIRNQVLSMHLRTLSLIKLDNGELLFNLKGHKERIKSTALLPDNSKILSASEDGTLRMWDLVTGKLLSVFPTQNGINALSRFSPEKKFICGTNGGELIILNIRNMPMGPPLLTGVRLWRFGAKGKRGSWDAQISAACPWCGKRFFLTPHLLETIHTIHQEIVLSPNQSPYLELPVAAWNEPELQSECHLCKKPIHFNPFIVDNRDRE